MERPKVTKGLLPRRFAFLRRVPSLQSSGRRHAPTGLFPSPSMASAKARFEHPCSRANSGSSRARPDPNWPMPRCGCAVLPDGATDPFNSPWRLAGGPIPCPKAAKWARYAALKMVGVPIWCLGLGMREGTIPNRGVAAAARSSSWPATGISMRLCRIGRGGNQRGALHRVSEARGRCPRRFSPATWRRSVELLAYDGDLDAALPHRGGGNQRGALHRVSEGRGLCPRRFSPAHLEALSRAPGLRLGSGCGFVA